MLFISDDDDKDEDEEEDDQRKRSYYLREHKPQTNLYTVPVGRLLIKLISIVCLYIPVYTRQIIYFSFSCVHMYYQTFTSCDIN